MNSNQDISQKYKAIIAEEVSKAKKTADAKTDKEKIARSKKSLRIITIISWSLCSLFVVGCIIVFIINSDTFLKNINLLVFCGVIAGILFLIPIFVFFFNLFHINVPDPYDFIDFEHIYKSAFNELFDSNYKYIAISKQHLFEPLINLTGNIRVNNYIHFKDDKNNIFTIGSLTKEEIKVTYDKSGNKIEIRYYYCYRILSAKLKASLNIDATVSNKLLSSKDNATLESKEFESKFSTYTNDQISVRRLLTPKVIEHLTNLYNQVKTDAPYMKFSGDRVFFYFSPLHVEGFDNFDNTIKPRNYTNSYSSLQEAIINKVEHDYKYIRKIFIWLKAYDLLG